MGAKRLTRKLCLRRLELGLQPVKAKFSTYNFLGMGLSKANLRPAQNLSRR